MTGDEFIGCHDSFSSRCTGGEQGFRQLIGVYGLVVNYVGTQGAYVILGRQGYADDVVASKLGQLGRICADKSRSSLHNKSVFLGSIFLCTAMVVWFCQAHMLCAEEAESCY